MPKDTKSTKEAPKDTKATVAKKQSAVIEFGEKLRKKMDSMRGPTERMGKRIQEAFPAISNKFPEKTAADANKSKLKTKAKKPAKRSLEELRDMPRAEGYMQDTKTFKGRKPVPVPMATEVKKKAPAKSDKTKQYKAPQKVEKEKPSRKKMM